MDKFSRRALLRISTHSYFSYDCRVSSIRSQAFIRCSAISLEYFSPSDSVVHTFESRQRRRHFRWGVAARRQQRERERVHSLKTFHGIHSKCTPSKCDARGSNARTPAKRRRIFLSLSLFGASRRRARLWRAPSPRVVIILRVRAFPPDGNFFSLRQPAKSRNGKFSQQRDTFNLAPSLANRNNFPSPFSPARV